MKTYEVKCKVTKTRSVKSGIFSLTSSDESTDDIVSLYIKAGSPDEAEAVVGNQLEMCRKLQIALLYPPGVIRVKTETCSVRECTPREIMENENPKPAK